jgi:LCP family protein required for cell wall assembly
MIGADSRAFVPVAQRDAFGTTQQSPGDHADLILLVRIFDDGRVSALSIPRDLLVELRSGAPARITLALTLGPQELVDSVCQTLGVGVDHLILIHFDGLERLVNSVGGVSVDVPAPLRDVMSNLMIDHAGNNHLDGEGALAYIRARHIQELQGGEWIDEPASVNERSTHALQVLREILSHMNLSLTSPGKSIRELWTVAGATEVDRGADIPTLVAMLRGLQGLDSSGESQLDVVVHQGAVPIADLAPDAKQTLAGFAVGSTPQCRFRPIPPPQGSPTR